MVRLTFVGSDGWKIGSDRAVIFLKGGMGIDKITIECVE